MTIAEVNGTLTYVPEKNMHVINPAGTLPDLSGMGKEERIDVLKARLATMGALATKFDADASEVAAASSADSSSGAVIGVTQALADLLPGGGLKRQETTALSWCPALAVELAAEVTRQGMRVAIVGWPELSYTHALDAGDLTRMVLVPDPGETPAAVTAVFVEGIDLVIHKMAPGEKWPQSVVRRMGARLRRGHAALIVVGSDPTDMSIRSVGAGTMIDAQVTGFRGLGQGWGRITALEMSVSVTAGAGGFQRTGCLVLSSDGTLSSLPGSGGRRLSVV